MSPTIASLDEIDYEISVAYIALGVVRGAWQRCPSGENEGAVQRAEAEIDRLLDDRNARRRLVTP